MSTLNLISKLAKAAAKEAPEAAPVAAAKYAPDFSAVKVYELPRKTTVFHTTDTAPQISTKEDRLIPNSLSAVARSPDYLWGKSAYAIPLPRGTRIGEVNSIFDLLPEGAQDTPNSLGALLRKYAEENSLDVLKIRGVGGVGTEWSVLNPEFLKNATAQERESFFRKLK